MKNKKYIFLALIALIIASGGFIIYQEKKQNQIITPNEIITIKGYAEDSKSGLIVDGIVLIEIDPGDERFDKYVGKYLKVKGYVTYDHPWKPKVSEYNLVPQGFTLPVMSKITSIEILAK